MELNGEIIIKCSSCGAQHIFDADYLEYESFCGGEGGMGECIGHSFGCETKCENCGNTMSFSLIAYEYPIGCKDYSTREFTGCDILSAPEPEMGIPFDLPDEVLSVYELILCYPQRIDNISPSEFETLVADVFRNRGFIADVTQQTRDGGKDIVATCAVGDILFTTYFECKQQAIERPVGVSVVRALYGVLTKDNISKGVIVTTSRFTRDAIKLAAALNGRIQLVDRDELFKMING